MFQIGDSVTPKDKDHYHYSRILTIKNIIGVNNDARLFFEDAPGTIGYIPERFQLVKPKFEIGQRVETHLKSGTIRDYTYNDEFGIQYRIKIENGTTPQTLMVPEKEIRPVDLPKVGDKVIVNGSYSDATAEVIGIQKNNHRMVRFASGCELAYDPKHLSVCSAKNVIQKPKFKVGDKVIPIKPAIGWIVNPVYGDGTPIEFRSRVMDGLSGRPCTIIKISHWDAYNQTYRYFLEGCTYEFAEACLRENFKVGDFITDEHKSFVGVVLDANAQSGIPNYTLSINIKCKNQQGTGPHFWIPESARLATKEQIEELQKIEFKAGDCVAPINRADFLSKAFSLCKNLPFSDVPEILVDAIYYMSPEKTTIIRDFPFLVQRFEDARINYQLSNEQIKQFATYENICALLNGYAFKELKNANPRNPS